jgi:hypothetical protein
LYKIYVICIIQLKRNLSFSEYQLIVDILENMGIEIEKPVYSPYDIIEEDIISIEKSREA